MESFQVVNGQRSDLQEICVSHAIQTFLDRNSIDQNAQIVQMVIDGEKIPHWYYRSDEYVDQPYFIAAYLIQPLTGPPDFGFGPHYGEGAYEIDQQLMDIALRRGQNFISDNQKANSADATAMNWWES